MTRERPLTPETAKADLVSEIDPHIASAKPLRSLRFRRQHITSRHVTSRHVTGFPFPLTLSPGARGIVDVWESQRKGEGRVTEGSGRVQILIRTAHMQPPCILQASYSDMIMYTAGAWNRHLPAVGSKAGAPCRAAFASCISVNTDVAVCHFARFASRLQLFSITVA